MLRISNIVMKMVILSRVYAHIIWKIWLSSLIVNVSHPKILGNEYVDPQLGIVNMGQTAEGGAAVGELLRQVALYQAGRQ